RRAPPRPWGAPPLGRPCRRLPTPGDAALPPAHRPVDGPVAPQPRLGAKLPLQALPRAPAPVGSSRTPASAAASAAGSSGGTRTASAADTTSGTPPTAAATIGTS